jgi:hypothetical protein
MFHHVFSVYFRKERDNINEQLKQKEIQLNTFGKTLQELESVTRQVIFQSTLLA